MICKLGSYFLLLTLAAMSFSCGEHNENRAGVKHFYFEFIDKVESAFSQQVIVDASKFLPQHDYLMSEESASKGWPFYGNVKRGSIVLKSDMMPPHTNVNRLSPITQLDDYNNGEHTMKVVFIIEKYDNSLLTISKESFEWSGGEWHKYSMKITTDFKTENISQVALVEKISKTLIRYTFK